MPKPNGRCAFCGGQGLTKEHIYPRWARSYFPNTGSKDSKHDVTRSVGGQLVRGVGKLGRSGSLYSQRLRIVCATCNNGWMSVLQNSSKDLLIQLFKGEKLTLEPDEQAQLARWVVMYFMVAEFADPPTMASSPEEREALVGGALHADRHVYTARLASEASGRRGFWHSICRVVRGETQRTISIDTVPLAKLLLHSVLVPPEFSFDSQAYGDSLGLTQIWPNRGETVLLAAELDAFAIENCARRLRAELLVAGGVKDEGSDRL
jgi:hypothetical protein